VAEVVTMGGFVRRLVETIAKIRRAYSGNLAARRRTLGVLFFGRPGNSQLDSELAWATQMSPGDVRTLRASQLAKDPSGAMFFAARGKTGTPVGGALSDRALAALESYIAKLGVELHGEAYIFRNRSGAPYSSDTLGDDFRDVRRLVFGEREQRTLADFRRSGAVEAIAGGARAEESAHAMGNTLSASNALHATYVPVNLATIRGVMDARRRGRTKLR
jgi:hypothetical protein